MSQPKKISDEEKRKLCAGCYNSGYLWKKPDGFGCWSFKDAKPVMRKEVHKDQVPPWRQKPITVLSCYNRPRYVYVAPDREH